MSSHNAAHATRAVLAILFLTGIALAGLSFWIVVAASAAQFQQRIEVSDEH